MVCVDSNAILTAHGIAVLQVPVHSITHGTNIPKLLCFVFTIKCFIREIDVICYRLRLDWYNFLLLPN